MTKLPPSDTQLRKCPFCSHATVDEGIFEDEGGGVLTRTDACPSCDGTWRIEFQYTQWAVVLHPETLEEKTVEGPSQPGIVLAFPWHASR